MMLLMFTIPAAMNYHIIMLTDYALWWKVAICTPLFLLAGNAVHLMGFIGHEGFHFGLYPKRMVSAVLGLFFPR